MPSLEPVDYDPFARLQPVDYDPWDGRPMPTTYAESKVDAARVAASAPQSTAIEDRRSIPVDPLRLHMEPDPLSLARPADRRPMEEFNATPLAASLGHGDINPYEDILGYGEVPEPKERVARRRYIPTGEQFSLELQAMQMRQAMRDAANAGKSGLSVSSLPDQDKQ